MRQRAVEARVGRLATVTADGRPHVVPCCFAIDGDVLYSPIDDVKPKSTLVLRRLDNIRHRPAVTVLIDQYAEDWTQLWWVRLDGNADLVPAGTQPHGKGWDLLATKYAQYRRPPTSGVMITVEVLTWRAWP